MKIDQVTRQLELQAGCQGFARTRCEPLYHEEEGAKKIWVL